MTATPLDVLETRGLIGAQAAQAGRTFARAYALVFGAGRPASLASGHPGAIDDGVLRRAEAEVDRGMACLDACGRRVRDEVVNAAVYYRWPRVVRRDDARARGQLDRLRLGLNALAEGVGGPRDRGGRSP